MNKIVKIKRLENEPSKIYIGSFLDQLANILPDKRVIIITDANLHRHYTSLIDQYENIIIGMGETNKTLVTMDIIYNRLIAMQVDRECFILGFGGGVVTDITGFAASTYMRGLPFGFVATTLLAQVDASVGGKNGVNVDGYKNMIGTFNQPDFVVCDITTLNTLPRREMTAGFAEIIKVGIICDTSLFELFEANSASDFVENPTLLSTAITAAVRAKADIVTRDEKEINERRKLNLGHTFAHAIEKCSSEFMHGEAVAIGVIMASNIAVKIGVLTPHDADRIRSVVTKMGFPQESGIDTKRLLKAILSDKKRSAESINIVLPTAIGSCEVRKITFEELEGFIGGRRDLGSSLY